MTVTLFSFLMVIALGSLAGTGTGLGIGFLAGKQKGSWTAMTKKEKTANILLVLGCSLVYIAALGWYAMQ
jgi:ABC-type antimicrobial peptide transport system permease subunit